MENVFINDIKNGYHFKELSKINTKGYYNPIFKVWNGSDEISTKCMDLNIDSAFALYLWLREQFPIVEQLHEIIE
jgi:hypothetical protein